MKSQRILVSGIGIAGPALAYWLNRSGHHVTLIEKAPQLRRGGQNIDISDAAIEIVRMMGVEKEILAHNTTEIGLQIVDERNNVEASFPRGEPLAFTSEYEILRGDLAELLFNLTKDKVESRFGTSIKDLEELTSGVRVTFEDGKTQTFDLVIAADGVSSSTRKKIVDDHDAYKYLGVYTSYATIPKRATDTKWARWFNAPKGRVLLLRPDNKGTTRASVNYWFDGPADAHFTHDEAVAQLQKVLRGAGWESDRIAADLAKDDELYLGPVSQVHLKTWSSGRCVLVGDAAYCPTPFTGMGTTLAIIGAYILAGELSQHDYETAFRNYEAKFRPFVEDVQSVHPLQFRLVYPQTKWGVRILNGVISLAASSVVQGLAKKLQKKPKENERKFALPKYDLASDRARTFHKADENRRRQESERNPG